MTKTGFAQTQKDKTKKSGCSVPLLHGRKTDKSQTLEKPSKSTDAGQQALGIKLKHGKLCLKESSD